MVLFWTPDVAPVTLTMTLHEVLGDKVVPRMLTSLPLELTSTIPPFARQLPLVPLGDATKPPGSGSSTATFKNVVLEFGLPKVRVREVVPFSGMLVAPKVFAIVGATTVGAAVTVRLAVLLVAPGPLSLAEIVPVVLLNVPVVVAVTSTDGKQPPLATNCAKPGTDRKVLWLRVEIKPTAGPIVPPVRVTEVAPGTAVNVPPQSLLILGTAATTRPAGKLSVNVIPVKVTSLLGGVELLFGFSMVKLNKVDWFWAMVLGRNSLLIVGGKATPRVADAVLPVPPLVELTPVVFR